MTKMKSITHLVASAALAVASIATSVAQNNLGQSCGCPLVSDRGMAISISTLGTNADGELTANTHLTCDKLYLLDKKIYVPDGVTLTIDPGTVIKGKYDATPANATALIVERGGKIMASGTKDCQIVFTAEEDPMDGDYSLTNVGKWGGIVILGKGINNLQSTNVYYGGTPGTGFIEGFSAANPRDIYGGSDNADNSGTLKYVSIRHAGAILAISNELNGLSLGSVGSGTTIEHIEIVACADDNIECFGGAVNLKYISTVFGDDDMLDYDLGYKGKVQFFFGIPADSLNTGSGAHSADNGIEADSDDDKKAPAYYSTPVIYNATIISNGHVYPMADNSGPAAIQAKELTGGEIYNSIFANFRSGLHLATSRSNGTNKGDAYDNWTNTTNSYNDGVSGGVAVKNILKVQNNTFILTSSAGKTRYALTKGVLASSKNPAIMKNPTLPSTPDSTQFFVTDGNVVSSYVAGIDYDFAFNGSNNGFTNNFHAIPTSNLTSTMTAPADGFFTPVSYRGAFDAASESWLSDWALTQLNKIGVDNPTDIDEDGDTDIDDFGIFVGKFNQKDN